MRYKRPQMKMLRRWQEHSFSGQCETKQHAAWESGPIKNHSWGKPCSFLRPTRASAPTNSHTTRGRSAPEVSIIYLLIYICHRIKCLKSVMFNYI
jgi:hypothetical protein